MKKKNVLNFVGRLYSHSLDYTTTKKGVPAIAGEITITTDEQGGQVGFRVWANEKTGKGTPNKMYQKLDAILQGKFVIGENEANGLGDWVTCFGNVDVEYYISKRDGQVARSQKLRFSSINATPHDEQAYDTGFDVDFLITRVEDIEANEERHTPRFAKIHGYLVDDYNKRLVEAQFQARADKAIDYFTSLSPSEESPYFTNVWGGYSKVVTTVTKENAFGDPEITTYTNSQWVITGGSPSAHEYEFEEYEALKKGLQDFKKLKESEGGAASGSDVSDDDLPF